MHSLIKTGFFLVSAALLAACEMTVEVLLPEHTPKLALHYMLGNDKPDNAFYAALPSYQPYVSYSQSIVSTADMEGMANVDIVLTDASGKVVEIFRNDSIIGNGYYKPNSRFVAQPGQTYTLTASVQGFETITSTQTLPGLISGLNATYVEEGTMQHFDGLRSFGKLTINLPDNGNENNYYLMYAVLLDGQYQAHDYDVFAENMPHEKDLEFQTEFQDVHFSETRKSTPQPFNDAGFNGRTITLTRDVNLYYGDVGNKRPRYLRVMLHSITAETYRYLKSYQAYEESNDNPFAEPVRVIGNLNNGYGYFGAYTSTVTDITLP